MGTPPTEVRDQSWSEVDAKRAIKAVEAERYIRDLVDRAPLLTPEQRDRLALLLRGRDGGGPRAA
jgi:hypothetical protein